MTPDFQPNRNIIELLSWTLFTKLYRRYSDKGLKIVQTHMGGAQSDCLTLVLNDYELCSLDRLGSLSIAMQYDGSDPRARTIPNLWGRLLGDSDPYNIRNEFADLLGLKPVDHTPPSTSSVLVFRTIMTFLRQVCFGIEQWRCINGYIDNAGNNSFLDEEKFQSFSEARERLLISEPDDVVCNPATRFWILCRDNKPVACLDTSGFLWTRKGKRIDLMLDYAKRRSIMPFVVDVLEQG